MTHSRGTESRIVAMLFTFGLVLLQACTPQRDSTAARDEASQNSNLVPNNSSDYDKWRVVVALKGEGSSQRTESQCSGIAIAPNWVLTADHCRIDNATNEVVVGNWGSSITDFVHRSNSQRELKRSTADVVHLFEGERPEEDSEVDLKEDLILLHLDKPIDIGTGNQFAILPPQRTDPIDELDQYSLTYASAGFGQTDIPKSEYDPATDNKPNNAGGLNMTTDDYQTPDNVGPPLSVIHGFNIELHDFGDTHLGRGRDVLVDSTNNGGRGFLDWTKDYRTPCLSDSGGPLMLDDGTAPVVLGLTIGGLPNNEQDSCGDHKYGVYLLLSHYSDMIVEKVTTYYKENPDVEEKVQSLRRLSDTGMAKYLESPENWKLTQSVADSELIIINSLVESGVACCVTGVSY